MCNKSTVRESSHISFFSGGAPFCEVVRRPENTHEELTRLSLRLSDHWISPFSPKLLILYRLFKSHTEVWTSSLPHVFFLFMAGDRNLHTSGFFFFLIICWSYLGTEISVILSIGNKLYSRHQILYLSFLWKHFVDVILRPPWIC